MAEITDPENTIIIELKDGTVVDRADAEGGAGAHRADEGAGPGGMPTTTWSSTA